MASPAGRLAAPGARRREYRFVRTSRRPPRFGEESVMKTLHRRCAGLDVQQQEIVPVVGLSPGARFGRRSAVSRPRPRLARTGGPAGGRQGHACRHGGERDQRRPRSRSSRSSCASSITCSRTAPANQGLGEGYRRPRNPARAAANLANPIRALGYQVDIRRAA
jgi:hypothetical protein